MGSKKVFSGKISKRLSKYLIYLIIISFVFGGLYTSYAMPKNEEATQEQNLQQYNILVYDSQKIASETVECKVTQATKNIKILLPQDRTLSEDELVEIFESNITGVKSIMLEVTPNQAMFNINVVEDSVIDVVKEKIGVSGTRIYGVYLCDSENGVIEVVGNNLKEGEEVNILLVELSRAGFTQYLGFQQ